MVSNSDVGYVNVGKTYWSSQRQMHQTGLVAVDVWFIEATQYRIFYGSGRFWKENKGAVLAALTRGLLSADCQGTCSLGSFTTFISAYPSLTDLRDCVPFISDPESGWEIDVCVTTRLIFDNALCSRLTLRPHGKTRLAQNEPV